MHSSCPFLGSNGLPVDLQECAEQMREGSCSYVVLAVDGWSVAQGLLVASKVG